MPYTDSFFLVAGAITVLCPAILLALVGVLPLLGLRLSERTITFATEACVSLGWLASIAIFCVMWSFDIFKVPLKLGHWVEIPQEHFHLEIKFVFDRLSVPFLLLTGTLCGVIGAFASRYLHRDVGYYRFFLFFAMFYLGMVVSSLAGTIETLFLGWELVGLSSALLVAFFHERKNPVRNGLRVWSVYRISDGAFLIAALALHHLTGAGDFEGLMGAEPWPLGTASCNSTQALAVGLLLLGAAAGKSALVPFSGWLPRAMEGPTPSSAVFYGALSVHLGAFLLLRVSPLLDLSWLLQVSVIAIGIISVVFASMTARTQTDIKSELAFASLTQVGIIVIEIGLGFRYVALCHIIGHVCLRTLQLLRAPSILRDYRAMENAIGDHLAIAGPAHKSWIPTKWQNWLYRLSIERGTFDIFLDEYVVGPFLFLCRWSDRNERRWTRFIAGESSHDEADEIDRVEGDQL
jgi:NADH:ubiquinone oxidoreductase subunit 5 (subunit L)/multisubunit Na+/H+ antiporter MnhA subunit